MPSSSNRQTCAPLGRANLVVLAAALAATALSAISRPALAELSIEAVDRSVFRVCVDPDNLPYSGKDVAGIENKIAELFAKKLNRPLVYKWAPKGAGFYVTTLDAKVCDVVLGVPAGIGAVLNTNPYYRMTYVMAYRKDSGLTARSLADPKMKELNIGVIAGTPPNYLMVENGLLGNMRPYRQINDPGADVTIATEMMNDLKDGNIDVAVLAGPPAYYWAKEKKMDVEIIPLENAKHRGGKMDYLITMGVRLGEHDWKQEINELIRANQDEIDAIIESFGIPVLDLVGPPVPKGSGKAKAGAATPASATVPAEPDAAKAKSQ